MALKGQGGRNKRGIMAEVLDWRKEGHTENKIRDNLKARDYQPSRITELIKKTKDATALPGAAPMTHAKIAALPPQGQENGAVTGPSPGKKPKLQKVSSSTRW